MTSKRTNFGDGDIKSSQGQASIEAYKVDGTGTASILIGSKQAILTDNGTGNWTLTFKKKYARQTLTVGNSLTAAHYLQCIDAADGASVNIKAFDAAGAAVDTDFIIHVMGFDYAQEY